MLPWIMQKAIAHLRGAAGSWRWGLTGIRFTGRPVIYGQSPSISGGRAVSFGDRLQLRGFDGRITVRSMEDAPIVIGHHVLLNSGVTIQATSGVMIGDNCLIGDNCQIQDTNYHEVDEGGAVEGAPIVIGRNVWLGRDVIVLPGVTIGDHSVVAARSVVTKSIPERSLAIGSPAIIKRKIVASDGWIRR